MPASAPSTAKPAIPTASTACIPAPHVPSVSHPSFFTINNASMPVQLDILHQLDPIYVKTASTPVKTANPLHLNALLAYKDTFTTTHALIIVLQAFTKTMSISYVLHVTQNALNAMEHQHIAYRVKLAFTIFSLDAMQAVHLVIIHKTAQTFVLIALICV